MASACFPAAAAFEFGIPMRSIMQFLLACLVVGAQAAGHAQVAAPSSRGELLYSTHCIACHNREVHWRQQKLATDWASLESQVRRWSGNAGLGWSSEEIGDVTRYLNAVHYRFTAPTVTGFLSGNFERK